MAILATARPLQSQAQRILEWALASYRDRIVLSCSFGGAGGMVLVDLVSKIDRSVPVFYLDTGLLFPETHALIERVKERYGIEPIAVAPELDLAAQAERHGDALWARDPDGCCAARKVAPQRNFLRGYDAWITGLRRDQTSARADLKHVDWNAEPAGLAKISPLADWTEEECLGYIRANGVPYNALADDGYPSVGCRPCTRRVRRGEGPRAGRWADFAKTECGLHAVTRAGDER